MILLPDLAEFQANANMAAIRRANGGAAILRAAYGQDREDLAFAKLRKAAAGFRFLGLYQYIRAGQDAAMQASAFCGLVGALHRHEIPIADVEEGDGNQLARTLRWCAVVESRLGKRPWVYSGESFAEAHGLAGLFNGSQFHTWVAAYRAEEPALGHTLWQSTDGRAGAHITDWPGAGNCDTNVYHGTLAELAALATGKANVKLTDWHADGKKSLHEIGARKGVGAMHILRLTAIRDGMFAPALAEYGNGVFDGTISPDAPVPEGVVLRVPA